MVKTNDTGNGELRMSIIKTSLLLISIVISGCAITKNEYAYLNDNSELIVVVEKKSYFDPDGFSRTYSGKLVLLLGEKCENDIRNNSHVKCKQGDGFTLPVVYENECENGYINFVSLKENIDISFNGKKFPCKYYSNKYPFRIEDRKN